MSKNRIFPIRILAGMVGIYLLLSLSACGQDSPVEPDPPMDTTSNAISPTEKPTVFTAQYIISQLETSSLFQLQDTAWLKTKQLKEISGIARSSNKDHLSLWGHNDSFNQSAIYLLDTKGYLLGTKYLKGVFNRDWEDIAGGPGPIEGKYYLYVGEIGDNLEIFPSIAVYRFEEPTPDPERWKDSAIEHFDAIRLAYPDGSHNAEALWVDPLTRDIYIITKGKTAGLYVARYPQDTKKTTTLVKLGLLPIKEVTAADISADGKQILIKNYDHIFYWKRKKEETIAQCLQRTPEKLAYHRELQGEAIAWEKEGKGFYTLSEQVGSETQILYYYISP